jgi:hypothetical protein
MTLHFGLKKASIYLAFTNTYSFLRKGFLGVLSVFVMMHLLSSCNERYFHLSKVKAMPKRGTFNIVYNNHSPSLISNEFEKRVRKTSIKNLEKQGFRYTEKQPNLTFSISLKVDTAQNISRVFHGPSPLAGYYDGYKKFITILVQIDNNKISKMVYERDFTGYFYNNFRPDIHRTVSFTNFLLNDIPEVE